MKENKKAMREAALHYESSLGWCVLPAKPSKSPYVGWKEHQKKRPNAEQLHSWWQQFPHANVGVITGGVSGIVVLDLDAKHKRSAKELAEKGLHIPATASARTGGGGEHYFFKHPGGRIKSTAGVVLGPGVDIRADGGFIVLAPSIHSSGKKYEWMSPPEDGIAEMPDWLLEAIKTDTHKKKDWNRIKKEQVPEGIRNSTATSVCGKILYDIDLSQWETIGWNKLQAWNKKQCVPPLSERELRDVFDSIAARDISRREEEGSTQSTQSTQLVELVTSDPDAVLFLDQYRVAHARIPRGSHFEIWPCRHREFKYWLSDEYYKKTNGKAPSPNAISGALNVLEGRARADGIRHTLHNRIVEYDGAIWYDFCDEERRAVRIDKNGWKIIPNPPILFRRHTYQDTQVEPTSGGDLREVLQFVNVRGGDQELLFLTHLVTAFIPGFPHAILYVYGPHGSAKSTLLEIVNKLVDPTQLGTMSLPRKKTDELVQILSHHSAFAGFDNVSYIEAEVSDLFCRAVTGAGFSKRLLYSDGEDYIFRVQANIAINGINLMASKPDLLERSLLMELERVEDDEYKKIKALLKKFEKARPWIMGAIFDTVAKALAFKPTEAPQDLYRMADYTAWGCVIAEVFGNTQEAFLEAYKRNVDEQNSTALEGSLVAELVQKLMDGKEDPWEGPSTELLDEFRILLGPLKEKDLPKNGAALSRQLWVLKPSLEATGYHISRARGTKRTIIIRKLSQSPVDGVDGVKNITPNMPVKVEKDIGSDEFPF